MLIDGHTDYREGRNVTLDFDLVVVGGGMTGVCCALTAARQGIKVALIQDRPVLGGNASSEVRLWVLGATSHMGNNNRWSREGGVIDEILVENLYRNKEGNPVLFDTILLDKVLAEPSLSLFLNTVVYEVVKKDSRTLFAVKGFNPQSATKYIYRAKYFADCSGDGVVAYSSGVSFRMGAEDKEEYNELFAPDREKYGELLGHSILFYTKEMKNPVEYIPPSFALKEIEKNIPKVLNENYFNVKQHGCKYWWIEYGGRLDTVEDTEQIKYELWKVVYGIWDYLKNSGKYPETKNQTLEWVGLIPGKRESRRFDGYYCLVQDDIIKQQTFYDRVALGGWSIDLHPADGVYSPLNGCNQWHSKGIYEIPYRCYLPREMDNLFLGGRLISASHVAHGSTRVMCTSAHGGQAIGMAAALCIKNRRSASTYYMDPETIKDLQQALINTGQYIPGCDLKDKDNLILSASLSASSSFEWGKLPEGQNFIPLKDSVAQLIPVSRTLPPFTVCVTAEKDTTLTIALKGSSLSGNFTPDVSLEEQTFSLSKGTHVIRVSFETTFERKQYIFVCFMQNESVSVQSSPLIFTGTVAVYNSTNPAVSNYGKQQPPSGIGIEEFEFWIPKRWPDNQNLALSFEEPLNGFGCDNLYNSYYRPVSAPNGWVADIKDENPTIICEWKEPQIIQSIRLFFDTDFNQALENNQMGHHYNIIPHCVNSFSVEDALGNCLYETDHNYQTITTIQLDVPAKTTVLRIKMKRTSADVLPSLMGILCKSGSL